MLKNSNCRICRRSGLKLFLKGEKCEGDKCPFVKRSYAPGHLGARARMKRGSDYSVQLNEKQKLRAIYGISEKQLSNYYSLARKNKTGSGEILLQILERRLDNVVYKCGWVQSRDHARQAVTHGKVKVNNRKTKSPGFLISPNDVIEFCSEVNVEKIKHTELPAWVKNEKEPTKITILSLPTKPDISDLVNEQFVIEFYSR